MAEITEARLKMSNGTEAVFVGMTEEPVTLPQPPYVAVHVADLDAARDVLDTLERSRARKRAVKDEDPLPPVGPPQIGGEPPQPCIAPGCKTEATMGSPGGGEPRDLCHAHALVPDGTANEWRRAQAKAASKARATGIRESVEPEKVA